MLRLQLLIHIPFVSFDPAVELQKKKYMLYRMPDRTTIVADYEEGCTIVLSGPSVHHTTTVADYEQGYTIVSSGHYTTTVAVYEEDDTIV